MATPLLHEEAVDVVAVLLLVVEVFNVVVVVACEVVELLDDVVVEVLLLELLPTLPPGPLRFDMPDICKVVGSRGSIS